MLSGCVAFEPRGGGGSCGAEGNEDDRDEREVLLSLKEEALFVAAVAEDVADGD